MGAKFEPNDGQVLHGLGQYVPTVFGYTDAENWQYVSEYQTGVGHVPVIYAAYQGIHPLAAMLDSTDLTDIVQNHGYPYYLNLGLALYDETQTINVTEILNGDYDAQIISIATEVKSIRVPCFVRPGFEFGTGSSGVHSGISGPDFILVWNHIRSVFATVGVDNVAWVWNAVNPDAFDYMSYYPGDDAVDWWGINYFTVSQMNSSEPFVLDAASHNKPVIVCESCPIHNGGTGNADNWADWFVPYFGKITGHAHLKAFTYISDPWDKPGFWDEWATSLIDENETIRSNYAAEMGDARYVHHKSHYVLDLTVKKPQWGRVDLNPEPNDANAPNFPAGTLVTLTAEPNEGKSFKLWKIDDPWHPGDAGYIVTDTNNPIAVLMVADREVKAVLKCGGGMEQAIPLLVIGMSLCGVVARRARRRGR